MRADAHDVSVVHDDDLVAVENRADPLRHHDDGRSSRLLRKGRAHARIGRVIQCGEAVVE